MTKPLSCTGNPAFSHTVPGIRESPPGGICSAGTQNRKCPVAGKCNKTGIDLQTTPRPAVATGAIYGSRKMQQNRRMSCQAAGNDARTSCWRARSFPAAHSAHASRRWRMLRPMLSVGSMYERFKNSSAQRAIAASSIVSTCATTPSTSTTVSESR